MHTVSDAGGELIVPGSISNLGPGFDALSVAVRLHLSVRIVGLDDMSLDGFHCEFVSGPVPVENRIATAYARARLELDVPAPGVRIEVASEIPAGSGLGSSGAATIAGLRLYERITGARPAGGWLPLATSIEGHPDNAAAALLGGLAASCQHPDGRVTARAVPWPSSLRLVVGVPRVGVATSASRTVLPRMIPLRDAVFNLQHALLLVEALRDGDLAAIRDALADRWHQHARAHLVPGLREALALDDPALLGVCLSGSGPSIVGWTTADGERRIIDLLSGIYAALGIDARVFPVAVHQPILSAAAAAADAQRGPLT